MLERLKSESTSSKAECIDNLIGIYHAIGRGTPKNFEIAYAIFTELANRNFPPSQLNLGIVVSEKSDHDPRRLMNYFLGLTLQYMISREWGFIGASARDFYRGHLKKQRDAGVNMDALESDFESGIKHGMVEIHGILRQRQIEQKEVEQGIVNIIMLGASVMRFNAGAVAPQRMAPQFNSGGGNGLYHVMPVGNGIFNIRRLN
jgi:hypothetical protein